DPSAFFFGRMLGVHRAPRLRGDALLDPSVVSRHALEILDQALEGQGDPAQAFERLWRARVRALEEQIDPRERGAIRLFEEIGRGKARPILAGRGGPSSAPALVEAAPIDPDLPFRVSAERGRVEGQSLVVLKARAGSAKPDDPDLRPF